jgi:hypothetical protein
VLRRSSPRCALVDIASVVEEAVAVPIPGSALPEANELAPRISFHLLEVDRLLLSHLDVQEVNDLCQRNALAIAVVQDDVLGFHCANPRFVFFDEDTIEGRMGTGDMTSCRTIASYGDFYP